MLLLDAAEELHKTASHDGPEPSTAATHGMLHPGCLDWRMDASDACVTNATAATHWYAVIWLCELEIDCK